MNEDAMQHGRHWSGQGVRGWLASEKFRGVRVYWDGAEMWTRGGLCVALPAAWRAELPAGFALDGELWAGRGPENGPEEAEATAAAVRGVFTDRLRFLVFDAPDVLAPWSQRMATAAALLAGRHFINAIGFEPVKSMPHLEKLYAAVIRHGGEGLMLRSPDAPEHYEAARTGTLLKVKIDPALRRGVVRVLERDPRAGMFPPRGLTRAA